MKSCRERINKNFLADTDYAVSNSHKIKWVNLPTISCTSRETWKSISSRRNSRFSRHFAESHKSTYSISLRKWGECKIFCLSFSHTSVACLCCAVYEKWKKGRHNSLVHTPPIAVSIIVSKCECAGTGETTTRKWRFMRVEQVAKLFLPFSSMTTMMNGDKFMQYY